MKKTLAILLGILFILNSVLYVHARTYQYNGSSGWSISDDGIIFYGDFEKIAKEENGKYVIRIPNSICGIQVKELRYDWLRLKEEDKDKLSNTEIYIPGNVETINDLKEAPTKYYLEKGSGADKCLDKIIDYSGFMDSLYNDLGYSKEKTKYNIEYKENIERIDIEDEIIEKIMDNIKKDNEYMNNKITSIDVDIKTEYINKLKEYPLCRYFLFDANNDNVPELYIVNTDEKGIVNKNNSALIEEDKKRDNKYVTTYCKAYYNDAPKINTYNGTFSFKDSQQPDNIKYYTVQCGNRNNLILVEEATNYKSENKDIVKRYYVEYGMYSPEILFINNDSDNITQDSWIPILDLFNPFLNGDVIPSDSAQWAQSADTDELVENDIIEERNIPKYKELAEKILLNPVKTYAVTDMTGINNWDFSKIEVTSATTSNNTPAKTNNDDIKVILNDNKLNFAQSPVIEKGTTLVPMRAIFEAMGASVEWDGATQTVTSVKSDTTISLTLNKETATVNGKDISLAVPAKLINGNTMVPLRFVGESLGAEVNWDGESKTITIKG